MKRDVYTRNETYKRDVHDRLTKRDQNIRKEAYKRDLDERPVKGTNTQWNRPTKET